MASSEIQSMIAATMSCSGVDTVISKICIGLAPSSVKNSVGPATYNVETQHNSLSPRAASSSVHLSTRILANIPLKILDGLIEKYARTIVPQFPFMLGSEVKLHASHMLEVLQAHRQAVVEGNPESVWVKPSWDFLIIYLVLAISINIGSVKGGHEARCMSFSASLFEEGLQHMSGCVQTPTDLAALQVNLLILLYATINPGAGNVWILSGSAMRVCLVSANENLLNW